MTTPSGTTIQVTETSAADTAVSIVIPRSKQDKSPENATASIHVDGSGTGALTLRAGGSTITLDASGIRLETPQQVRIDGSTITHTACMVDVQAPMSSFAGMTEATTAMSEMVVATAQSAGAGTLL